MKHAIKWLEYVCWLCGSFLIGWVAFSLLSGRAHQQAYTATLENLQRTQIRGRILQNGDVFGRISIPRLGMSAIIVEGIDEKTLRHAIGHFPESSMPESSGTVALAGHRDTFFRGLEHIRMHDRVTLETATGKYSYQVIHTSIVSPYDIDVIRSSTQSDLTLVTCYPFHYVGQAPQRFIVQALRIRSY